MLTSVATLFDPRYKKTRSKYKEKADRSYVALIQLIVQEECRQSSKVLSRSSDTEVISTQQMQHLELLSS